MAISDQLDMLGLDETVSQIKAGAGSLAGRSRKILRVERAHDLLSQMPAPEDLFFLHSGLCQTFLPHSRPASNRDVWRRSSGKFSMMVSPGVIDGGKEEGASYVGVPFGVKARLILIHLQTEGMKGRTVDLGASLSAFIRSLGLPVTGGERGTIKSIKEQTLRIARCRFTLQWTDNDAKGNRRTMITDQQIVDGLDLFLSADGQEWTGTVQLSERFQEHLQEHAVPLDKRGIALLSGNSLGLDLYALFAYRLPKLTKQLNLRWSAVAEQLGSSYAEDKSLARAIREALVHVADAYPSAKFDVTPSGLILYPSPPAVPKTQVQGMRLITS